MFEKPSVFHSQAGVGRTQYKLLLICGLTFCSDAAEASLAPDMKFLVLRLAVRGGILVFSFFTCKRSHEFAGWPWEAQGHLTNSADTNAGHIAGLGLGLTNIRVPVCEVTFLSYVTEVLPWSPERTVT